MTAGRSRPIRQTHAGRGADATLATEMLLVRHGQTDWNVERRRQGRAGPGINARGRAEAQGAAKALLDTPVDAIYTSDLARARETAEVIGEALGLPVRVDPRLRERDQGEWDGVLTDDVQARYPEAYTRMLIDPLNSGPPGGETGRQVLARVTAALDDIAACHPGRRVVVVTHSGPIALVHWLAAAGLDPAFFRPGAESGPPNGAVVPLIWPPAGRRP